MNNMIIQNAKTLTMSSTEIAELTGKRHDHVLTDIRKMFAELKINAPDFSGTQNYGNNNSREVFNLPKDLTLTLISGYSVQLRKKIIDRWLELESDSKPMSQAEMILAQAQTLVEFEREQKRQNLLIENHDRQISDLSQRFEIFDSNTGYCTVTAYFKRRGISSQSLIISKKIGQAASKRAKRYGMRLGEVPDERFGNVKSYPIELLDEVVPEILTGVATTTPEKA